MAKWLLFLSLLASLYRRGSACLDYTTFPRPSKGYRAVTESPATTVALRTTLSTTDSLSMTATQISTNVNESTTAASTTVESPSTDASVTSMNETTPPTLTTTPVERNQSGIVGTFPTYDDLMAWLEDLCAKNPDTTVCGEVGLSYEGRKIIFIKIGNLPEPGQTKRKIWIEGTQHGREWLVPATLVYIIDLMVNYQEADATVKRMVDTYDWYFIPMSNPDGYVYSHTHNRNWRKNRSRNENSTCLGVDLNRNWDFHWADYGGSSSWSCSGTFRGSGPFSEPETKALSDFILENRDNTHMLFSIHSHGQMWLLPYAIGPRPDDYDELMRVANIGAEALMAVHSMSWAVGTIIDLLYKITGDLGDWTKAVANITYSYGLELRPNVAAANGFVVPQSEIEPSGQEVWAGLVAAIDAVPVS